MQPRARVTPAFSASQFGTLNFLAVLLVFFVAFSTLQNSKSKFSSTPLSTAVIPAPQIEVKPKTNPLMPSQDLLFAQLSAEFPNAKKVRTPTGTRLEIKLPENIFQLGQYSAPTQALDPILIPLHHYAPLLSITVVGFADQVAFQKSRPVIQKNNLALASIRAAFAATYVQSQLSEADVLTQASVPASADSAAAAQSRTLTLWIEKKKANSL